MDTADLLVDLYGRLPELAHRAVAGAGVAELLAAPAEGANPVAWLVWHAARVQDHHVSEVRGVEQLWTAAPTWAARCALAPDPSNTGYGHGRDDVAAVRPADGDDLLGYFDAVQARTMAWLPTLDAEDLDRVVDTRFDPPVRLGVRLVSVADDSLQHLGQAAYVRGLR